MNEILNLLAIKEIKSKLYTESNDKFIPLYDNQSRYLVLKGGGGSGKSIFAGRKILHRTVYEKGHRFLVVRKVAKTLRESCFKQLKGQISKYYNPDSFKINETDMRITYLPNGNEILFAGLDDVEKLKSIYDITGIWIEEASELDVEDYRQLDIRLRGETKWYKQILFSFNPVSITHWLKSEFFDVQKEDCTTSESTYKDNKFLDAGQMKVLEGFKTTDPYYYQVYCLGEWGVLGKTVFDAQKLTARLMEIKHKLTVGRFETVNGKVTFIEDVNGFWTIYKRPGNGYYVIGADVAEGSREDEQSQDYDYHSCQVLDNSTLEQMAEYHGNNDDPDQYSEELIKAGYYYNTALINPETNMEGGVVRNLERQHYPKIYVRQHEDDFTHKIIKSYGFKTTETTRRQIVADLIEYVRDHTELINSPGTIDEMLTFIRNKNGRPEAQSGKHDDRVMSYALSLAAALSGQQIRAMFSKEIDRKKLEKLPQDCQDDYWNADEQTRKHLAERWNLY